MKLSIFAIGVLLTATARAQTPPPSSELVRNADGGNESLAGIGRFRGPLTCTGSLIDPSGSGGKAWLLTAGHCVSLEPFGVIRDQPLTARVEFRYFVDTPAERRVVTQTRAVGWSTMKGVDLALIELNTTVSELGAQGVRPLRLAASTPEAGRPIYWAGISGSPIPPEMQFVRRGRCTQGRSSQVVERFWIWTADVSNDCPDLYEGASGSPVFDAQTSEVIGVIGTSTILNFSQGPDYDCQLNRPCAIRPGGPAMEENTSYTSQVAAIARCFDAGNSLDVLRPGCPLDPGAQLTIQSGATEVRPAVDGKAATWGAALSGKATYYAYKRIRAGEDDCASAAGYSMAIRVADAPVIEDAVGIQDGYYFLCVIAGDTAAFDASWQQPRHASIRRKRLDSQPPAVLVDYELQPTLNGYQVVLTGGEAPNGLGVALTKRGPLTSVDCADAAGYRVQLSIPDEVKSSDQPHRICNKLSDNAGNFGEPAVFDFGPPALLPNAARNSASLQRGTVAPGGIFRVDTFNLTTSAGYSSTPVESLAGVRLSVRDGAGRTLAVPMTSAGPLYLEGVLPEGAAPGEGALVVQPPKGPSLSQAVTIRRTSPGLYGTGSQGAPRGYAWDANGGYYPLVRCVDVTRCVVGVLPVSTTSGGLNFVVYATGLRAVKSVTLRIGTYAVEAEVVRHAEVAGLDELRFHLPQDFPLRLYQAIAAQTADGTSNYLWVYLE